MCRWIRYGDGERGGVEIMSVVVGTVGSSTEVHLCQY